MGDIFLLPFVGFIFLHSMHSFQDSLLLGKIHVALLKLLISDVETELSSGFSPRLRKSCNFLALLHSVSIKPCRSQQLEIYSIKTNFVIFVTVIYNCIILGQETKMTKVELA